MKNLSKNVYPVGANKALSKKELREITALFMDVVLGPKLAKNVLVSIFSCDLSPDLHGNMIPFFNERSPRDFAIGLNRNDSRKQQIITLAHEIVHVQQYARNHLRQLDCGAYRWKKSRRNYYDTSKTASDKLPWEKEALNSEKYLYAYYKNTLASKDERGKK